MEIDWDKIKEELNNQEVEIVNKESDWDLFKDQIYYKDGERTTDEQVIEENIKTVNKRKKNLMTTDADVDYWFVDYLDKEPEVILKDKEEQKEIANRVLKSLETKDNVILEAPTGWGKTGLAYQIFKQSGKRVLILNHSNVLLKQYVDLLEHNLKDDCISIMGKTNYRCFKNCNKNVVEAKCDSGCPWRDCPTNFCEYYWRKEQIQKRNLVISNYHQQLLCSSESYDIVVCDECHNIEKIIVDYSTVVISQEIINRIREEFDFIKSRYKDEEASIYIKLSTLERAIMEINETNYKSIFITFYETLKALLEMLKPGETVLQEYLSELINPYERYEKRVRNNEYYENYKYDNYIFEQNRETNEYKLVPLFISKEFREAISRLTNKLVLMSATVINPENMAKDLGLDWNKTEYIELGSKVKKENRPIYSIPTCKISMKDQDFESSPEFGNLCNKIIELLNLHEKEGESGFIYCNSYKLSNMIYRGILGKTNYHIYMNSNSRETKEVLNQFLDTSKKNRLLISCSFAEGVNFNDDISRFQIIPKIPYMFLGSKRISVKNNLNNRWYINKAIEQIIQVAGRSVRSPEDNAITYILDSAFNRTYLKYKEDYPSWFNEAISLL